MSTLSHKPAVLLPLQRVFRYSLHIRGLIVLCPRIHLLSSKFRKKLKPEYMGKFDRGTWLTGTSFYPAKRNSPSTLCKKNNFCPYMAAICEGVLRSLDWQKACCCRKSPRRSKPLQGCAATGQPEPRKSRARETGGGRHLTVQRSAGLKAHIKGCCQEPRIITIKTRTGI